RNVLTIPDTLTLSEVLDRFRSTKEKFAVVINEYALVVGVITLSDIMITVMGDWVTPIEADQQIIKRDNNSWLIEGSTPIEDMKHALEIDSMPDEENYETLAGFMMFKLRSEEHTSELQSRENLVCRLLLEKKKKKKTHINTIK